MGASEIEAFLTHLAVQRYVAGSTQNQALCALIFLYRHVLCQEIDLSIDASSCQTIAISTHSFDSG
jgi:Phage integrase, N-terminal SAM-like domain